jgi:hypothetical protein
VFFFLLILEGLCQISAALRLVLLVFHSVRFWKGRGLCGSAFYLRLGNSAVGSCAAFLCWQQRGCFHVPGILVIGILRQGYVFGVILSVGILRPHYL